ncbi:hypothetical protein DKX38_004448 [Salix brachista]|uniref:Bifunctional inhibitor/plant lipid transfer protein/seed storage helical domain-containing protein n=1 Tax=Salix brachista TaxID=2182728 RepID=A0A5N5NA61_9ROSI|nr:hypothetical protein DKX38_004448 [Salix brachista]
MASSFMTVMVALVFVSSTATLTKAQDSSTSCATKLLPCQAFLATTTTPPDSCCNPIKEAVTNELPCLCKIYNDPNLLPALVVNVTQAVLLSTRCGVPSNLTNCNVSAPTPAGTPPVDEDDEKQERKILNANKEIEMEVCVCVLCDIASGVYLLTFFDLQDG